MERVYYKDKTEVKKSAVKGAWLIVGFAFIFAFIIIRFATSGSSVSDILSPSKMPNADDAYKIAKAYVKPDIKLNQVAFPDRHYQYGKNSDSVFVIRSFATGFDDKRAMEKVNFEIILKYQGGPKDIKKNWSVVDIMQTSD